MKYIVSFIVAVAVLYIYGARHPLQDGALSWWVDAVGGVAILTVPVSMLCRVLTRKIRGLAARSVDLALLFCVAGAYWAISLALTDTPQFASPLHFWLRLTLTSWATLFLPFIASVAIIEALQGRKKEASA